MNNEVIHTAALYCSVYARPHPCDYIFMLGPILVHQMFDINLNSCGCAGKRICLDFRVISVPIIILEVGNTNICNEACTTIYPSALSLSKINQYLPPALHKVRS